MKPDSTTEKPAISTWTTVKRKARKILYLVSFFIVILLAAVVYYRYFYTYSEGYRAGLLQKFSRKGAIFKTYEGELILSSVAGRSDVVIASEKFFFSVTDPDLAANLDTLQGRNVIVRYKQRIAPLIWRGDTPYYVDSVRAR
ncbi:MAG: hypothetical protein R6X09_08140 [Bacteroidales bacterium]